MKPNRRVKFAADDPRRLWPGEQRHRCITCAICEKQFMCYQGWVYRMDRHERLYKFCSYSCYRKAQEEAGVIDYRYGAFDPHGALVGRYQSMQQICVEMCRDIGCIERQLRRQHPKHRQTWPVIRLIDKEGHIIDKRTRERCGMWAD